MILASCSWTVYEPFAELLAKASQSQDLANNVHKQFAELFAKASRSPTLANTIHEQFINSSSNCLPKPFSHLLWQTLFMNISWAVNRTLWESQSGSNLGKHYSWTPVLQSVWWTFHELFGKLITLTLFILGARRRRGYNASLKRRIAPSIVVQYCTPIAPLRGVLIGFVGLQRYST